MEILTVTQGNVKPSLKKYNNTSDTALFLGCISSIIPRMQKTAASAIKLLEDSGREFRLLPEESCCGYILYTMGDVEGAKEAAKENIQKFEKDDINHLITACPGYYLTFYSFYPHKGLKVHHIFEEIEPQNLPQDLTLTIHYPNHLNKMKKITKKWLKKNKLYRTYYPCCGGNLISYAPKLSREIAQKMIDDSIGTLITYWP
jgi:Fe-S oxidoreductase